ncbi:tetratricopeptide repeat protein [Anabaena sp. CCY 9910]|uniref:tetratricopeptide repeat protein n=1 Tax=Anabaena sp. CCY 9910 TaxID=3103870 RepID=UPI0039E0C2B9
MVDNYEYQVGASLPPDAPSYVVRKADSDFYHALKAGKYCYVFNSRQMGKSSLKVRVMQRLVNEGVACSSIDVSGQGSKDNVTQEQWYTGIVSKIVKDLQIAKPIEFRRTWWRDRHDISPVQRLDEFIEDVLLSSIPGQIIIFIDEIDSTLSLGFASEDFFALIRSCYNKRSENPAYKRLTFALLGVATPGDLIQDKTRTPFNIGEAIELDGFKIHEIEPLAKGLAGKVENPQAVMQEVLAWTGGQPFLTQRVCELLGKALSIETRDFRSVGENQIIELVKEIINNQIIDNWEANDKQEHLKTIRDRLLISEEISVALLGLYQQILQQKEMTADSGFEQMRLRLTGLVVQQQGKLRVYNQIYGNVFDIDWVENELDKLRFYADKLRAWVESNYQDNSCLLSGEDLEKARVWADRRKLSDIDYRFLSASVEFKSRKVKSALEVERKANQILAASQEKAELDLEKANKDLIKVRKAIKHQIYIGSFVLVSSAILAIGALLVAGKASQHAREKNDEVVRVRKNIDDLRNESEKNRKEFNSTKYNLQKVQDALNNARKRNQELQENIQKMQNEKASIFQELIDRKTELSQVQNQLQKTERVMKNKIAEFNKKNYDKEYQYNQVKSLLNEREQESNQIKLMIDNLLQKLEVIAVEFGGILSLNDSDIPDNLKPKIGKINDSHNKILKLILEYRGYNNESAQILTNLGNIYLQEKKYLESLKFYEQALSIYRRSKNNNIEEATVLNNIATVYVNLGEYKKVLELYNKSLAISREVKNRRDEGVVLSNIAVVYRKSNNNDKSLEYSLQALAIFREIKDRNAESRTLNNIGRIYEKKNEYAQALNYYNQALSLSKAVGNRGEEGEIISKIGEVYSQLGDKQKALNYYQNSLVIARSIGYKDLESRILVNIGVAYYALGNYEFAINYLNKALEFNPSNADAYYHRAIVRLFDELKGSWTQASLSTSIDLDVLRVVMADLNKVLSLNPKNADVYYYRGVINTYFKEYKMAIADFQIAANLYQQEGKIRDYENAQNAIRKIQNGLR